MIDELQQRIIDSLQVLYPQCKDTPAIELCNLSFGDFTTNIAMIVAKRLSLNPMDVAQKIVSNTQLPLSISSATIVKPGFINFSLSQTYISEQVGILSSGEVRPLPIHFGPHKKIIVEFAHPNTHKLFHIGHLRNICIGESVARLLEHSNNTVIRANYQGDVGLHIAKCIWGIQSIITSQSIEEYDKSHTLQEKMKLLGTAYSQGQIAYDESEENKKQIQQINAHIYNNDPSIRSIYTLTRSWSLSYFEGIYKRVGVTFDRLYFESEMSARALALIKELSERKILKQSEGAIVFDGSPYGLDTRVFLNSLGYPTYEGKELALAEREFSDFGEIDTCIHVVTPEQRSFFKVTFKVEELINSELFSNKQYHLAYEWVRLMEGKMSSRTGNVIEGPWLIDTITEKIKETYGSDAELAEQLALASIKYSFLKTSTASEIAFSIQDSISLEGNSAPYILYSYVRAHSLLIKLDDHKDIALAVAELTEGEKEIIRLLLQYKFIVAQAASKYAPHYIATYVHEVSKQFNLFYQQYPIFKAATDTQKNNRILITRLVEVVLRSGLGLLGIPTIDRM